MGEVVGEEMVETMEVVEMGEAEEIKEILEATDNSVTLKFLFHVHICLVTSPHFLDQTVNFKPIFYSIHIFNFTCNKQSKTNILETH